MHMLVYFGGLVLGQTHMVLKDFAMLVITVDYSVVGYYILLLGVGSMCNDLGIVRVSMG